MLTEDYKRIAERFRELQKKFRCECEGYSMHALVCNAGDTAPTHTHTHTHTRTHTHTHTEREKERERYA